MVDQIAIALTGATAIWLSQDERAIAEQWGIFALSFARPSLSLTETQMRISCYYISRYIHPWHLNN